MLSEPSTLSCPTTSPTACSSDVHACTRCAGRTLGRIRSASGAFGRDSLAESAARTCEDCSGSVWLARIAALSSRRSAAGTSSSSTNTSAPPRLES